MSGMIIDEYKNTIDTALTSMFPKNDKLSEAARYSLTGGKRLRGIIALIFGAEVKDACALEMIHAFSLIHDDLPCMDNDDFRRGKPSCHKQFGEATALLAGDMLLAEALRIAPYLAHIARDIIRGQQLDVEFEKAETVTEKELLYMYRLKTATLFHGSVCTIGASTDYGFHFGMAFQITDDLLDFKTEKPGKKTLPLLIGEEKAREKAAEYVQKAVEEAKRYPRGDLLKQLAQSLIGRRI